MKTIIHNLNKAQTRSISATPNGSSEPTPNGIDVLEELIADEGMKLTQSADTPLQERILATAVMLGKGCSSDEWKEIPQAEADEIRRQQEEIMSNTNQPDNPIANQPDNNPE